MNKISPTNAEYASTHSLLGLAGKGKRATSVLKSLGLKSYSKLKWGL